MPVTVRPASHAPRECIQNGVNSAHTLLQRFLGDESAECKRIIQSSFDRLGPSSNDSAGRIVGASNGFVRAAQDAYSQHHRLTIRPEDVWFSILAQLSFYINANAKALRPLFVAHEGKKKLVVADVGTIDTIDLGKLAVRMTDAIAENLVAKDLHGWIMPDFSTSNDTDTITAAVLMMGSLQAFFSYEMMLTCGIPSVTLLGTREDWVSIRARLDRLPEFGKQSKEFCRLLVPVLDHFVRSFDGPDDPLVVDFWSKIAHEYNGGSGPSYLSGWINAFCFWDCQGKPIYRGASEIPTNEDEGKDEIENFQLWDDDAPLEQMKHEEEVNVANSKNKDPAAIFDASIYGAVNTTNIPGGWVTVPVVVNDNGVEIKTKMAAGSVGFAVTSSGDVLDRSSSWSSHNRTEKAPDAPGLDSLQPVTGWFMYEVWE